MVVPVSKTKRKLIEVARQLFARNGLENTTMNDIAEASERGRRTLYTYFRSKTDIYKAVIESELQTLYLRLESVIERQLPADEKLMLFAFTRLGAIKEVVRRNGTLKADFFRDIWKVENVRKEFDQKEIHYLQSILQDGCDSGLLEMANVRQTAGILHYALKGLEVPAIRGVMTLDYQRKEDRDVISTLIFRGLYKKQ
ncbi:MAG TPA: TetR family transcriptional regulator [Porphyromonadaceae bacterium]|uniref:TetR/AcrR family transcriptional regulator n=1 Tax=Limibacterium fermenti TaxID=3229863 RepID=UPI000E849F43|nr:TetR family transcriptional regulator [Porphyromonadaceae bacterium]HBL32230.1 TetR family transcriptional regulator [Porphyromonadaceae bacterium]HBX21976.1 TetR family transcriptional regulator [Porphyromonadaceae bacterium]HBX46606.1 TetR family transcriptional regulator [Porphyromonadaceae bacterium]